MDDNQIAQKCRDTMWDSDAAVRELGMSVSVSRPGEAMATLDISENMVNGHDICHGGYIFTLADTAFAYACNGYNRVTVAASASIEFVRPAKLGDRLTANASEAHRGGRTGVYDILVSNQDGEKIAIFRGRSHSTRHPLFDL